MKKFLGFAILLSICVSAMAQQSMPVQVRVTQLRTNDRETLLQIKVDVQRGLKLFTRQKGADDLLFSTIKFDSSATKFLVDSLIEKGKIINERDSTLGSGVHFVLDSVEWQQKLKLAANDSLLVKGYISYSYKKGDEFLTGEQPIKFFVSPEKTTEKETGLVANRSLWWIFLAAFGGGLLALLTPCVYSMIPVTVSFFTKRSKTKAQGIRNALYYAVSIITIFTLLGFLVTIVFGPAALNNLATNWVANLIFFVLFMLFGISFLGAFEINLPSSWMNKSDEKAGTGSFIGIFFMAMTLVLVSFSCTGPIIGNLLVLAAKGSYYGPLVGMFGFSLALALPFALFAFFPSKLNVLGKAGGWLNSVKVTLGFLELALALKFLSNADLANGWRILDREVFISLWIVIFVLLGIYLMGKLKFSHDDELPKNDFGLPYLSVTRLFLAMVALVFAVYMVPGLWGAPLKGISAFLPPLGTQDFTSSAGSGSIQTTSSSSDNIALKPEKYYEKMRIYEPEVVVKYGMVTYFDYNEALAAAKKLKKPLMLDFTGRNCPNCRKMESQVWSDPEVMKRLKENFVIVSLYVDVQNIDLPQSEQYFSKTLNKQIETIGDQTVDIQVSRFGANSQPYYFFLDANENKLAPDGYGYDPNINKFIKLLDEVKQKYDQGK